MPPLLRRLAAALAIGIGLLGVTALASGGRKKEKGPQTPFYRKYLVAGKPLDDRILAQERLVAADPESASLRNDFGNLLAERRFSEQAREQYEKALELDREEFLAAYNLGLLHEAEGKTVRAMAAYKKSIARKPGFPHSHFRLGRLYEKRGWEKSAVSEYAKALRLDPGMRDPRINPLIIDSRLVDRASLVNYDRDLASAALAGSHAYGNGQPAVWPPVDQPIWSDEVEDPATPEPVADAPSAPPISVPQTSPPRVAAPAPPPAPADSAAPPAPEYEVTPSEEELPPVTGDTRPPYIGGFRPTPTPQ
ncbi:MAG: tetratricopeptide repeat protein [Thermoanaerobaculia bacterium]